MRWGRQLQSRVIEGIGPLGLDVALAAFFVAVSLITVATQDLVDGLREPGTRDYITTVIIAAPIAVRRRWPLGALGVALAAELIHAGSKAPEGTTPFAIAVLVYSVAAWAPVRVAVAGITLVTGVVVLLGVLGSVGLDGLQVVLSTSFFMLVWASGLAVRARRDSADSRVREATQRAEVEVQRAARAVAEERLRIAQELHDVVAHSISVIAVQAGVASHFLRDDAPAETVDALDAIGDTSRATLNELRRILGVLRGDDGRRSHSPAPTLDDLPTLLDNARRLGLDVRFDEAGERDRGHRAVEMSAYRIVQEALTNVTKHAGATTHVNVCITHGPEEMVVEIADDGRGAAQRINGADAPSGHHGLIGMRERVEVWGGRLDAGPRSGGGFAVRAVFPLENDQ